MSVRVLLADPDESLLETYHSFLTPQGFEVVTATDGLDCIAKLRDYAPDVLVLELDMPWGGGVGVLAMMHEGHDVPLVPTMVLTTSRDFQGLDDMLLFEAVSDYHVKPLAPEQLARIIRRVLDAPPPLAEFWELARDSSYERTQGINLRRVNRAVSPRGLIEPGG